MASALLLASCSTSRRTADCRSLLASDSAATAVRTTVEVRAEPARVAVMGVCLDSLLKLPLTPQAVMTAHDGPLRLTLRRTAADSLEVKAETDSLPRTVTSTTVAHSGRSTTVAQTQHTASEPRPTAARRLAQAALRLLAAAGCAAIGWRLAGRRRKDGI